MPSAIKDGCTRKCSLRLLRFNLSFFDHARNILESGSPSENASGVFHRLPCYLEEIWKRIWIFICRKLVQGIHMIIGGSPLWKSFVFQCFPSTQKRIAGLFKFFRVEGRFRKVPFRDQYLWNVCGNRTNKLRLQIIPVYCGRELFYLILG